MSHYVQFKTADNENVLVEVSELPTVKKAEQSDEADQAPTGIGKVALSDKAVSVVTKADAAFESSLDVVRRNANAFLHQISQMIERPSEVAVEFGLKLTGEMGLFAVAKAGGEANFVVKLKWKSENSDTTNDHKGQSNE